MDIVLEIWKRMKEYIMRPLNEIYVYTKLKYVISARMEAYLSKYMWNLPDDILYWMKYALHTISNTAIPFSCVTCVPAIKQKTPCFVDILAC